MEHNDGWPAAAVNGEIAGVPNKFSGGWLANEELHVTCGKAAAVIIFFDVEFRYATPGSATSSTCCVEAGSDSSIGNERFRILFKQPTSALKMPIGKIKSIIKSGRKYFLNKRFNPNQMKNYPLVYFCLLFLISKLCFPLILQHKYQRNESISLYYVTFSWKHFSRWQTLK